MSKLKPTLQILTMLALLVSSIAATHANERGHSYKSHSKWNQTSYKNNSSRYAQNNNVRSRSDVMNEVKQRYNAKVLKISLNEQACVYSVRLLMPNGKVRSVQVNAR